MPKFIVTVGKGPIEIGTIVEWDEIPASVAGKVTQVPDETPVTEQESGEELEVATPEPARRGRPPKQEQE